MQPIGSLQRAPKGVRHNGSGGLSDGDVGDFIWTRYRRKLFSTSLQEIWRTGDIHWPMKEDPRIHHFPHANMLRSDITRLIVI